MAKIDEIFSQLVKDITSRGYLYEDPNRKGVKRKQLSDYRFKYDFKHGFPILTLRKIIYSGAIGEFVSFMNGENNLVDLSSNKVNFWKKDGYNFHKRTVKNPLTQEEFEKRIKNGDKSIGSLGKIYPVQMRKWNGNLDQIEQLVKTLRKNPMATKKTVTMWNPSDEKETSLTPCHWSFEVLTEPLPINKREKLLKDYDSDLYDEYLNDIAFKKREEYLDEVKIPKYGMYVKWHQHSVDVFLGLPSNIIYYSLMCIALSKESNMLPLGIVADLSNVHIYDNALKASYELLDRSPYKYGSSSISFECGLGNLNINDIKITGYESFDPIKVEMLPYS